MNTLFSKAGLCNNQYSAEVNKLLKIRNELVRTPEGRKLKNLLPVTNQLRDMVKKERKQWLKDTLEDRKKEAKEKKQKNFSRIFDEYFN